ncbi:MAG: hypothetical protein KDC38_02445 [Planctomycetes bacterium]|nr:hypothetical protein [Planctomycetota bacterium]
MTMFLLLVILAFAANAGPGSCPTGTTGGACDPAECNGDVNGDCGVDVGDVIYLLDHLFQSGPPPVAIAGTASPANLQQFVSTSPGPFIWTTPVDITPETRFKITLTGGGGAGGGGLRNSCGGGGGATAILHVSGLLPDTAYLAVVGDGGAGSSAATGAAGQDTTLTIDGTVYVAGGGSGGGQIAAIGVGGTATGGAINVPGGDGGNGLSTSPINVGGMGGGTFWGSGGAQALNPSSINGHDGRAYGSGGSGSVAAGGSGGSGKPGIFVAEWIGQ